jgi:hypothetical protein
MDPMVASPHDAVDAEAEALFEEARLRARRRRRRIALAIGLPIAGALAAAVAIGSHGTSKVPKDPAPTGVTVAPRAVLAEGPYMGVACRVPNWVGCDRVGLAVWTRHFARSIDATVGGKTFALDDRQWSGRSRHGLRKMFAGFLQPAGLLDGALRVQPDSPGERWTGVHPVDARVRLVITRADGKRRTTTLTVGLSPGWG